LQKQRTALITLLFHVLGFVLNYLLLLERMRLSGRASRLWTRLGKVGPIEVRPEVKRVRLLECGDGATVEEIVEIRRVIHGAYAGPSAPQVPAVIYSRRFATNACLDKRYGNKDEGACGKLWR
jgi:hypothetical protein